MTRPAARLIAAALTAATTVSISAEPTKPDTSAPGAQLPAPSPAPAPAPADKAPSPGPELYRLAADARAAVARGDLDAALSLANDAIKLTPDGLPGYALRAGVHDVRREFAKSLADYDRVLAADPGNQPALQRRGEAHFRLGHFKQSVADFDKLLALDPARAPFHWQRGISLYYAGEFARGAEQFELHKTVNPDDVENAAWHYLCVAASEGPDKARAKLIPIDGDPRVPLMEIHALYAGQSTPEKVLAAAEAGAPAPAQLKTRLFYAHLYLGLYHHAAGAKADAEKHLRLAAEKYADDDYMGDVARAHMLSLVPKK